MLKVNVNNKYECAICHGVYDTVRTLSLHISLNHKRDTHEYYDEYCKDPGEGVCKVCGAPTRYRSFGDGYKPTCSHKCGSILLKNDPEKMAAKKAKTVATCMERYGVTNAGGTKESLEKAQQTHLAKHGVRWAMQSKEVVEKSKQTCLDRYGATTYVHSTEGASRVEATVAEKFGRTNFFSGAEGNKAARDGYMAKHGYDHNMHDPQFLEKWKGEQKAKYDGKFYVETDEFKDKSRATRRRNTARGTRHPRRADAGTARSCWTGTVCPNISRVMSSRTSPGQHAWRSTVSRTSARRPGGRTRSLPPTWNGTEPRILPRARLTRMMPLNDIIR